VWLTRSIFCGLLAGLIRPILVKELASDGRMPMQNAEELTAELDAARRQLEKLTAEVARNDEKLRRSQQRELHLLQSSNLDSLFIEMTEGLRESYDLECVSVVLSDPGHDIRHLLVTPDGDEIPNLHLVDTLMGIAPQYVALRRPWLGTYAACDHQLVFGHATGIASVAMIPLRFQGELIGSINLGSADADRFTVHHASDFLAQLGVIASFSIENAMNRARLRRSGFTDVVTGWHNRRYLQARIQEELARARRDRSNLVCLMLDIDHFKQVNDTWGHAAGDAVLRELTQRIESQVRASDVAARYGGEEFVILLPNTAEEAGMQLAERVRNAVAAAPFELPQGESVGVTVSIGISSLVPDADDKDFKTLGDALIARADVALYSAKAAGRDRVVPEAAA
jgi:diguanylate cyclase (GGDEF)-like protein